LRQWRNQAGQLLNDWQNTRRDLQNSGGTADDLRAVDEVLRALRALSSGNQEDVNGLQELSQAALERMRKFEFDLRRRLDTTSNELFLAGSENVPPKYRQQVEEYSKELAKRPGAAASPAR
jgi:hypothetical protein